MESNSRRLLPQEPGFFDGLTNRIKLIWRLLLDSRVNFLLKLIPLFSIVYWFAPDFFPIVDDALIMWLSSVLFVELCPPEVVEEHRGAIESGVIGRPTATEENPVHDEDVIEAEFWEDPKS